MLLGLASLAADPAARADQKDPQLDGLFARLRVTSSPIEARSVESSIWGIWMLSDRQEVNRLMAEGVEAMQASDFPTALADFTRIIEIAPDFAEGWNKRATVLYMVGDYAGSAADVDRTLALEPRHFGALSGLGLINSALEQEEAAIDAWEKALAINPNMPGVRFNIEATRQRLKDKSI